MKVFPITFDTETHLFGPGNMAPRVVCVSTALPDSPGVLLSPEEAVGPLVEMLKASEEGWAVSVGHNTAYDMACLLEMFPVELGPYIWRAYEAGGVNCTKVRERLLDIEKGSRWEEAEDGSSRRKKYSLATLANERFGVELDKETWRLGYGDLDGVPISEWPEGAKKYAIGDAELTRDLWQAQEKEAWGRDYEVWTEEGGRQAAFSFALQLVTARGLAVDPEAVAALRESIAPRLLAAREAMMSAGLLDPKQGSKKMAVLQAMVERSWAGEGEVPRTPTKKVQTSAEVVAQCQGEPGLEAFTEYTKLEKLSGSFVEMLEEAGVGPIHASYEVLGADTGRTSCYKPNIQQLPRAPGVRECFVAREGFVFISCDYDSQELRTLAQVLKVNLGNSILAKRYQDDPDFDPHTDFAAHLLGIDYAEAMKRKKAKDPEMLARRQQAKAANFGYPGGMGAKKFRLFAKGYDLDLSLEQSEALKEGWLLQWPEMRDYFRVITNRIDSGLTTFQQLYSGRRRGHVQFTSGCNTLFQGLAADASKNALWEVTRRCFGAPGVETSPLVGSRPVAFIHDEIIIEAPEAFAHEAAVELEKAMVEAMQELTPDVPARASPALMRRWTKKADAAFDADGRYICWEDRT